MVVAGTGAGASQSQSHTEEAIHDENEYETEEWKIEIGKELVTNEMVENGIGETLRNHNSESNPTPYYV